MAEYEYLIYYKGRKIATRKTQEGAHSFAESRAGACQKPSYNTDKIPSSELFEIRMRDVETKEIVSTELYTAGIVLRK